MQKLIRITTVPLSLEKLLEGQLAFMNGFYEVTGVSAEKERLEKFGNDNEVKTFWVEMTREITPIQDMKSVWKLYRYLKIEKPLIVHTHTPKAGIVGMLAAYLAGVPLRLHTVAGLPLLETKGVKRSVLNLVEKFTYTLATNVYPNSNGLKEIIIKEGFSVGKKIKVLGKGSSNGIDTQYFNPKKYSLEDKLNFKAIIGIPEDDIVFIYVGRLVGDKGINELVEAFAELNVSINSTSLLLVGPFEEELDPLKTNTLETIESHGKIFTTGYKQDVRPYFAVSDVLAFPSYREGFPNVVMQAAAMSLPAIVTDINGCNEIITQDQNGIIIPVKDKIALLSAMESLCINKEFREKFSKNARKEICEFYDRKEFWQILLKEYGNLEQEVIGKN